MSFYLRYEVLINDNQPIDIALIVIAENKAKAIEQGQLKLSRLLTDRGFTVIESECSVKAYNLNIGFTANFRFIEGRSIT